MRVRGAVCPAWSAVDSPFLQSLLLSLPTRLALSHPLLSFIPSGSITTLPVPLLPDPRSAKCVHCSCHKGALGGTYCPRVAGRTELGDSTKGALGAMHRWIAIPPPAPPRRASSLPFIGCSVLVSPLPPSTSLGHHLLLPSSRSPLSVPWCP